VKQSEPAPKRKPAQNIPALTGLRFFLAAWVVLHHLASKRMMLEASVQALPVAVQNIAHRGYLAVGVFFILSGFVLARSYAATPWNRANLLRFGAGRLARVYPIYLVSLIMISPFIFEDLVSPGRPGVLSQAKPWLLADYWFVLQGWTGPLPVQWNTPAWSLSCELFFYLCFPLVVFLLARSGRTGLTLAVVVALGAPFWFRWMAVPSAWRPIIHFADFLAGIAAASLYEQLQRSRFSLRGRGYWLYAPAALIGVLLVANPGMVPRSIDLNSALRPLNVLVLTGLALGGGLPVQALSARACVFLGQASYSIYILHIPLLWWYKRFWLYTSGILPQTASAAIYFGVVILVSSAAYLKVEVPANRRIRDWVGARLRYLC
jgi:peptidoglycan/LPS O-acetylase OafA/YrhL